ncbi:hypothetical protein LJB98_01210 [Bacteroidales bacterium OttesenSCG-928-M11]|nr:hypothetical protein [Bacteroidales bacterium OttesenSCG-928-M11]
MKPIKLILVILFLVSFGINAQQVYLDPNFGDKGTFSYSPMFGHTDINFDKDGNLYAVGFHNGPHDTDIWGTYHDPIIALVKIKSNGILDENFGEAGKVITKITDDNCYSFANHRVVVQPDQKIVFSGLLTYKLPMGIRINLFLVRCLPDGSLDDSFGENGIVILDQLNYSCDQEYSMLSLSDNSILLGITFYNEENKNAPGVIKIKEDGSLDESFGNDGILQFSSLSSQGNSSFPQLLKSSGGSVFGVACIAGSSPSLACFKFDFDGNLDISFGDNGLFNTNVENKYSSIAFLIEQQDNKLIIGGSQWGCFRLNSNGILDGDFPLIKINVLDAALQEDGKILLAGFLSEYLNITRLNIDGSIDIQCNNVEMPRGYIDLKFIDQKKLILKTFSQINFAKVIFDPDTTPIPNITNEESISITQESENISVRSESPIQMIQLINISAQVINTISCAGKLQHSFSSASLPNGVYLIKIELTNGYSEIKKIITTK